LTGQPDAVAVSIGPGSFTGLRAAIALAQGLAAGAGVPVLGITVAEALREQLGAPGERAVWVAIDSRRGRVFLDRDGDPAPAALDALPPAGGPLVVAGDAAVPVAARLAARGDDVRLSDARLPRARDVAAVAARQLAGLAPIRDAQPLYVDPPEARLPAGGLRPAPRQMEQATPHHAAALAALHAAAFPPRERWGADAMALQLGLPGAFGLIDPRGGMVLARVAADEAEILTIAVLPALRRQGIGRALLDAAAAQAAGRGAVALFLEVSAANHPAQALYAACGFERVGHRRRYYPDGADALILRRPL
jgi:ribosomal-protein-alanine N-acetyltransferase